MRILVAIVIAGVLIAAAILITFRWQIAVNSDGGIYRLDRWTGQTRICNMRFCLPVANRLPTAEEFLGTK